MSNCTRGICKDGCMIPQNCPNDKERPCSLAPAICSAPHYKMVCAPDAPTLCEYVNSNLLAGFVPVGGPLLVKDRLWQAMIRWPNTRTDAPAGRVE